MDKMSIYFRQAAQFILDARFHYFYYPLKMVSAPRSTGMIPVAYLTVPSLAGPPAFRTIGIAAHRRPRAPTA